MHFQLWKRNIIFKIVNGINISRSGVKATDVEEEELKPLKKQDKNPSQEDFLNILQTITSDIDKIKEKGERIEKLQKKILHAVTPNPKEKDELNVLDGNKDIPTH